MMHPWMTDEEIYFFDFLRMARPDMNVFEWGGGGSTGRWSNSRWFTCEHDAEWSDKILKEADPAEVYLCNGQEYIHKPEQAPVEFDMFLVDGNDRKECVEVAVNRLAPGGMCFLHDAIRYRADSLPSPSVELIGGDADDNARGVRMWYRPHGNAPAPPESPIATASIISYNRPDLLLCLLQSLRQCSCVDEIEWHLWQDCLDNSEKMREMEWIASHCGPANVMFHGADKHQGISRQKQRAMSVARPDLPHMLIEDDIIVAPEGLRLMLIAHQECSDAVLHGIGPGPRRHDSLQTLIAGGRPHACWMCFAPTAVPVVRRALEGYIDFEGTGHSVVDWAEAHDEDVGSSDRAIHCALESQGVPIVAFDTPRGRYTGHTGAHGNMHYWRTTWRDTFRTYRFPFDKNIDALRVRDNGTDTVDTDVLVPDGPFSHKNRRGSRE